MMSRRATHGALVALLVVSSALVGCSRTEPDASREASAAGASRPLVALDSAQGTQALVQELGRVFVLAQHCGPKTARAVQPTVMLKLLALQAHGDKPALSAQFEAAKQEALRSRALPRPAECVALETSWANPVRTASKGPAPPHLQGLSVPVEPALVPGSDAARPRSAPTAAPR